MIFQGGGEAVWGIQTPAHLLDLRLKNSTDQFMSHYSTDLYESLLCLSVYLCIKKVVGTLPQSHSLHLAEILSGAPGLCGGTDIFIGDLTTTKLTTMTTIRCI